MKIVEDKQNSELEQCKKQFLIGNGFNFSATIFAQTIFSIVAISISFLMMVTIEAIEYTDIKRIKIAFILLGSILLLYGIFGYAQKVFRNRYLKYGLSKFKNHIFSKILGKSIKEFGTSSSGKIINAFSNDLSSIEIHYMDGSLQMIQQVIMFIVAMAAMIYLNWILAGCVLLASVIPMSFSLTLGKHLVNKEKTTSDEGENFVDQVKDLLNGFILIKSFKAEKEVLDLFDKKNVSLEEAKRDRRDTNDAITLASTFSSILVIGMIFTIGLYMAYQGILSIGAIIAFVELSRYATGPLEKIVPLLSNRKAALELIKKISEVVEIKDENKNKLSLTEPDVSIVMKDLSFSFSDEKMVLDRINLTFIRTFDAMEDCAVIVKEDIYGNKAINAYLISDQHVDFITFRQDLGKKLPHYMLPAYMMQMDKLPVNRNGKLDKKALPEIKIQTQNQYELPENHKESVLCEAFREILGIDKIGRKDNFFELGGDSLKAMQVISKVRSGGYVVTVQNILQYQIVSSISRMMRAIDDSETSLDLVEGEIPYGAIQKLLLNSKVYNLNHFNLSVMFSMPSRVSYSAMDQAVSAVVHHHDMLRCRLEDDGKQVINNDKKRMYGLESVDLRSCKTKIHKEIEKAVMKVQTSMDLNMGPLLYVTIIKLNDGDHLHICIHHFVADALSTRIIAEDILTAYYYTSNQEIARLPQKTTSFKDWNLSLDTYTKEATFEAEEGYWNNLNKQIGMLDFPLAENSKKHRMCTYKKEVAIQGIEQLAGEILGSMEQILTAAVAHSICDKFGLKKLAISMENHGRHDGKDQLFVDRTVGWFTNIYPILFERGQTFDHSLRHLVSQIKTIPNYGMGYLATMEKLGFQHMNMPEVLINYLADMDVDVNSPHNIKMSEFTCGQDMDDNNIFPSSLSVNISVKKEEYLFDFAYDQAMWRLQDIKEISRSIGTFLKQIVIGNRDLIKKNSQSIPSTPYLLKFFIEKAEKKMEQYESNIVSDTVFRDYPLTGIQKISYHMKSRNVVINIPLFDKIDLNRFERCWDTVLTAYDVLRSSVTIKEEEEFLRIYEQKSVIPYLDASQLSSFQCNEMIDRLLEKMDCYDQDEMYVSNRLSSKVLLVKASDVDYRVLMTCSHLIFDRFSAEVLRNKIVDIYYGNQFTTDLYSYKDYYGLLRNQNAVPLEEEISKELELDHYCKCLTAFYQKYKDYKLDTFIYEYQDQEKWEYLDEEEMMDIGQKLFIKGMRRIFGEMELPLLTLHLARKNSHVNLFEYIGEFLDVVPITVNCDQEIPDDQDLQRKLAFVQKNDLYFSALFLEDENMNYIKTREKLRNIYQMKKNIFILNNSGILKSANNLVVDTEKYWTYYNVINVSVNGDGLFMNLPVYDNIAGELKQYLDSEMKLMMSKKYKKLVQIDKKRC